MTKGCQVYLWRCIVCGDKSYGKHPPARCVKCYSESNKYILMPRREEGAEQVNIDDYIGISGLNNFLYLIGSTLEGRMNAMCCSSVTQVTYYPPRVAVVINKNNLTHDFIKESGIFSLSPLSQQQLELAYHFGHNSGRQVNKFEKIEPKIAKTGSPIVEICQGYYDCEVDHKSSIDLNSHTMFVGTVKDAVLKIKEPLLTYFDYTKAVGNRAE